MRGKVDRLIQIQPGSPRQSASTAEQLNARDFTEWLTAREELFSSPFARSVPGGACTACCRSSMFVHIGAHEARTLRRIPSELLFPAPGLSNGNFVLGYDDKGHCPMLIEDHCSIYEDRPETCRNYDCRVFTATELAPDRPQTEIAKQVELWRFDHSGPHGKATHALISETAAFLRRNRDMFPRGVLPEYPAQLAALTLRLYKVFEDVRQSDGAAVTDSHVVRQLVEHIRSLESRRPAIP